MNDSCVCIRVYILLDFYLIGKELDSVCLALIKFLVLDFKEVLDVLFIGRSFDSRNMLKFASHQKREQARTATTLFFHEFMIVNELKNEDASIQEANG